MKIMNKVFFLVTTGLLILSLTSCKKNAQAESADKANDTPVVQAENQIEEEPTGVINFNDMDFPSKKIPQKYSGKLSGKSEEYFTFPGKVGEKMEIMIQGDSGLGMRIMSADKSLVNDLKKGEDNMVYTIDLNAKGTWTTTLYVTKEARKSNKTVGYSINFQFK